MAFSRHQLHTRSFWLTLVKHKTSVTLRYVEAQNNLVMFKKWLLMPSNESPVCVSAQAPTSTPLCAVCPAVSAVHLAQNWWRFITTVCLFPAARGQQAGVRMCSGFLNRYLKMSKINSRLITLAYCFIKTLHVNWLAAAPPVGNRHSEVLKPAERSWALWSSFLFFTTRTLIAPVEKTCHCPPRLSASRPLTPLKKTNLSLCSVFQLTTELPVQVLGQQHWRCSGAAAENGVAVLTLLLICFPALWPSSVVLIVWVKYVLREC